MSHERIIVLLFVVFALHAHVLVFAFENEVGHARLRGDMIGTCWLTGGVVDFPCTRVKVFEGMLRTRVRFLRVY